MPASAEMLQQTLIIGFVFTMIAIGTLARLTGKSPKKALKFTLLIAVISIPFLLFSRTPKGGIRDAEYGWPLIYAYAQSDAGLEFFHWTTFCADIALAILIGVIGLLIVRRFVKLA